MEEIREFIDKLERKKRRWEGEVGVEGSAMTMGSVRFLERQIVKLEKLQEKVNNTISDIKDLVDRHTQDW